VGRQLNNERRWGAMGGKTSASRTHHPARENKKGHNGRQRENPTKGNKKEYNGRQKETSPSERRTYHPTRGSKKGTVGDKGKIQQRETRKSRMGDKRRQVPRKGGRTIQQGETRRVQWETKGDKTVRKADTPCILFLEPSHPCCRLRSADPFWREQRFAAVICWVV
jgi:hypothetical protein